jgi:hypothetical protein
MSDTPEFMTHERIMTGEEYVSYSDYLSLQRERDRARALAEEFHRDQVRLLMERDAWLRCASALYDAAAYGLAQWESATPATLAEKIVPALQAFQKLKAQ